MDNSKQIKEVKYCEKKEDKEILLTIAIPTYNGSNTIESLLSILLPQVNNAPIEIIISDNCSTDNTLEIIKKYKKKYPHIICLQNKENIGADGNFLQCMKAASGKFTMLVSDDDIVVENAIDKIISFLHVNPDICLAYLSTVSFKDKYFGLDNCREFNAQSARILNSIVTTDKSEFFKYIGRQWGFTSCFLWKTERCQSIKNLEQYFGTYWLQSYVHILCSNQNTDKLGIIAGPCIAVGEYGTIYNFDTAEIEGIKYKAMLDFAITEAGYNKSQLYNEWIWKMCYLGKRSVVLEKSAGVHLTSKRRLFSIMKGYPYAWIHLFPVLIIPSFICKISIKCLRKIQGRSYISYVNRPT